MKKVLLILILLLIMLETCFYMVETPYVAVVKNNLDKSQTIKTAGLYFIPPFVYKVNLVYVNQEVSDVTLTLGLNQKGVKILAKEATVLVETKLVLYWHVTDPIKYLNYISNPNNPYQDKVFFDYLSKYLAKQNFDLNLFNQKKELFDHPMVIDNLGIQLDSLQVASIKYLKK